MTDAVPARSIPVDQLPSAAAAIARLAKTYRWNVRASYARGRPAPAADLVDSHLVKMRRGPVGLSATWENGSFRTAFAISPHLRRISATELKDLIVSGGDDGTDGLF